MKQLLSLVVVLALACLVACGGSSVEGTYYNVDNQSEYIELKPNGEFYLKAGQFDLKGKYLVEGKKIVLNPKTPMAAAGTIDKGLIIDQDGTRWQKK
jgi:uncharacterized lipoprotein YmbA